MIVAYERYGELTAKAKAPQEESGRDSEDSARRRGYDLKCDLWRKMRSKSRRAADSQHQKIRWVALSLICYCLAYVPAVHCCILRGELPTRNRVAAKNLPDRVEALIFR